MTFYMSIIYLQDGDTQLFDDTAKANTLNRFFNSTFSISDYTLPQISDLHKPSTQLNEITFDTLEVYKALSKLDISKAMRIDDRHPHLLKISALTIFQPVTLLFSSIMITQIIPEEWKIHKIIPVPKTCDPKLDKNYRPISLLSNVSKVLEKLIYDKIINFTVEDLSLFTTDTLGAQVLSIVERLSLSEVDNSTLVLCSLQSFPPGLSTVERLSASQRVRYERLYCIKPKKTEHQYSFLKHRSSLTQLFSSYSEVVESINSGEACNVI